MTILSREVHPLGLVHYPLGAGAQLADLVLEVDEYFQHGISLSPGDVVFDAGANIGAFAMHASRRAGGELELFCFEPIPPVYDALARNVSQDPRLGKAHLHQVGLTSMEGPKTAKFHYFKRLPCDTTLHLDEKMDEFRAYFRAKAERLEQWLHWLPGWLARLAGKVARGVLVGIVQNPVSRFVFERVLGRTELDCPLTSIEAVVQARGIERIDLLKVDVEGAELEVLLGIGHDTWPKIRQVVLEGHDKEGRLARIRCLLEEAGFSTIHSQVPPLAVERGLNNFILHAHRN